MSTGGQLRLAVGAAQNRNLFPIHFIKDRLPEWPEFAQLDAAELLAEIKALWERERELLPTFNEEQTEDRFIRPILGALGFSYTARPDLSVGGRRREPDYALYLDDDARSDGQRAGGVARYGEAVAVAEAKRFDRPLDRRRAGGSLSEDPVAQIIHYVSTTKVPFGILTNGRIWRLYAEKGDLVEGAYYEVDLVALLDSGDPRAFRQFAAFFAASAFRPDTSGTSFLDRALAESRANALAVGEALQRQVFAAVPRIAKGLLGGDEPTTENLHNAFEHALVFLYRLLFCLHAEARELLPVRSRHYYEYSVRRQRDEVAEAIDGGRTWSHSSARLYNDLEALFAIVSEGDEGLGVNEYNGRLFSASANPWLTGRNVPDELLAPALDGLFRLGGQMIDYRDLSVRHLGTIYERLLDYMLLPDGDGLALKPAHGRKDTGSYFTPEPIVDLIVERTLEPLLEKRSEEIAKQGLAGRDALDAFLRLRVLDPAMGSGHFLVSAAAYMGQFVATDPSYGGELEWREIQRLVAERCLYGVDLNPMAVELARLSLWLSTVNGSEPLTFLSNLRVGNSLVGADVDNLLASAVNLFAERLRRDAQELLAKTADVSNQPSVSGKVVHEKERIAAAAEALRHPLHEFADEAIAPHFPAGAESMFHWEIEFPEVFLAADGSLRSDRGFDAVVGNPPYIRIQMLDRDLAKWCKERYETAFGSFDAYIVFIERAAGLLRRGGRLGFIVPNKFLKLASGGKLRECLAAGGLVEEIIDFGDTQVFEGATNYTCVLIIEITRQDELSYRKVRPTSAEIPSSREIKAAAQEPFAAEELGAEPWLLVAGEEGRLLKAMTAGAESLSDLTTGIFTGLQTSADPVYILEDRGARSGGRLVYSKASKSELLLESDLLHPLASGGDVERYSFKPLDALLLFPYRRGEDGMRLITDAELAALPRTAEYLRSHEAVLRGREKSKMDHVGWYGYVYPKSLSLHDLPKLGIPRLCERLRASIDPEGSVYLDNVDVNGILPSDDGPSVWVLGCLLNSQLLNFAFRLGSVPFRGNFLSANKQFIAPLPIRVPDTDVGATLETLGRRMHDLTGQLLGERRGFLSWLGDVIGAPVGDLTGRTRLERPDSLDLVELLDILRRNRKKLSLDPTARAFRERLAAEHAPHVEKSTSLLAEISRAEAEVDDVVFDLYGVTAAQRTMVTSG